MQDKKQLLRELVGTGYTDTSVEDFKKIDETMFKDTYNDIYEVLSTEEYNLLSDEDASFLRDNFLFINIESGYIFLRS